MAKRHNEAYRLFKRGNIYHAYISFISERGERIQLRETTGAMEESDAVRYCLKRIAQIEKKESSQTSGDLPCLTVDEAFARYFQEKGQYLCRPKETLTRLSKLKTDFGVEYLHNIDERTINRFININKGTLSNATINRYLSIYSIVRKTAEEEWRIKTHPLKISKFFLKEPAENIKYLKDWAIAKKIIDNAAPHLQPIIYTALYTGMRLGNILNLKWENIDFTTNSINIKVKDRTRLNGKNHTIPMIGSLRDILSQQTYCGEYVFTFRGKPIKSITSAWKNIFYKRDSHKRFTHILKDPNLPYINFHTLRHTAATWILRKTNNLRIAKEILGHSDIRTTLKYAHVMDEEKRQALISVFEEK